MMRRRGRPPLPTGSATSAGHRRNITLSKNVANQLNAIQRTMQQQSKTKLGLSQCIERLIKTWEERN